MESVFIIFGVILIFLLVSILLIFKFIAAKKQKKWELNSDPSKIIQYEKAESLYGNCSEILTSDVINISKLYFLSILNFANSNLNDINQITKDIQDLELKTLAQKKNFFSSLSALNESQMKAGLSYFQILGKISDSCNCLQSIISPVFTHAENEYPTLSSEQAEELLKFNEKAAEFFNYSLNILKNNRFDNLSELLKLRDEIVNQTILLKKNQVQYLKNDGKGTKVSLVFLEVMTESKNLVLLITNIVEFQKDFYIQSQI